MWWVRAGSLVLLPALTSIAQENAPPGFFKGDLVSWSGTAESGKFIFRTTADRVYSCSYNDKTYIERDHRRITFQDSEKGDLLEVLSDYGNASMPCYARLIGVFDPQRAELTPRVRPRTKAPTRPIEPFGPRGNMTLSGLVLRVTSSTLTLKSRTGSQQTIRLRPDTRYSADGQTAEAANLHPNTVVFVRCGRNLDDEVEAFQVVWGEILQPGQ